MGMTEMLIILFVLVTIAQYLIGWASYFEKKYTHVSKSTFIISLIPVWRWFCIRELSKQLFLTYLSYRNKNYKNTYFISKEQVYQAKIDKKLKKLTKKGQNVDEFYEAFEIPKPSISNTLPVQIPKLIIGSIIGIPGFINHLREISKEQERLRQEQAEEERLQKELGNYYIQINMVFTLFMIIFV